MRAAPLVVSLAPVVPLLVPVPPVLPPPPPGAAEVLGVPVVTVVVGSRIQETTALNVDYMCGSMTVAPPHLRSWISKVLSSVLLTSYRLFWLSRSQALHGRAETGVSYSIIAVNMLCKPAHYTCRRSVP